MDLSTADPLAEAVGWLRGHADILAEFGQPAAVSGREEPPYPHLAVVPSAGGDDRLLRWDVAPEIQIETYGAPDGTPGRAELRRLHYVALLAMTEIRYRLPASGQAVVNSVVAVGSASWQPLPTGQPRWLSPLRLVLHPSPS